MTTSMRDKITILVNVHNRHKHLARQLEYIHAHYDRILVLDSSDVEYAAKDQYPNVEYHYYPKWEYVDKLADIVKKVETPYVHLCADDDFYVPESVKSCVGFLEENPTYTSAHGHYLSFHWDGKHFDTYPIYTHYIGKDICSDDIAIRLNEILSPYIQLLYSVHRTENLHDCFCLASENKIINHRLVELLVAAIAISNGNHKVLPLLYGVREALFNSAGTLLPSINDVLRQESSRGEYDRFVALIADYIHRSSDIPENYAIKVFNEAFQPYVNSRKRKMLHLPQLLPPGLRILLNRYRFRNGEVALAGLPSGGIEFLEDLDQMEALVRKYNINV
jgi:glycosyltransferase domain-containing protein